MGGDEFGMLPPVVKNEQPTISVARRIIINPGSEYTIDDQTLRLCCRIGISIYPEHREGEQELVRNADRAMSTARQRSGKYCIYSAKTL
ncbi:MAG: diguanylate cyclase [Gammaproteobacteria bacterium]|nr:diguanylate cyclase [Gammaproteobacteria bacterium]NNL06494.1 diguanylate cyclase [Gammaproteobacteria bacterium]